jgi:hypothetical protein
LEEIIVSKCQFFKQEEESIDHLTSECPFMSNNECLMRHSEVYAYLHYSICRAVDIKTTDRYTHMPKPVSEHVDVTVLWNQVVHTDREVTANKPDMIIKTKKTKRVLIDV